MVIIIIIITILHIKSESTVCALMKNFLYICKNKKYNPDI